MLEVLGMGMGFFMFNWVWKFLLQPFQFFKPQPQKSGRKY